MNAHEKFRGLVHKYLDGHSQRSIPMLARKAGLPDSTVRRIVQGESVASLESMLAIGGIVAGKDDLLDLVSEAYPGAANTMRSFHRWKEMPIAATTEDLNKYLAQPVGARITALAGTWKGTTREEVSRLLGTVGLETLEELIDKAHLVERAGKIHLHDADYACFDLMALVGRTKELLGVFSHRNTCSVSGLSLQSEAVSEKAAVELKAAWREFTLKTRDILTNPENRGDIPMFVTAGLDTLDGSTVKGANKA